ncbi:hypothetical protein NC651_022808 [Populus alba x Populus x berolinensis]|nr:hypothetical protein NC651_022808 [Populus alba x Populus x berolinensis]
MRVYQRCHLVGEGHAIARKERDLIACSNRLKLIFSFYTGFTNTLCRKIIGARWYIKGYEAEFGKLNLSDGVEFLSPRDAGGHGTHTSSTATGGLVENASFMGLAQGLARGLVLRQLA